MRIDTRVLAILSTARIEGACVRLIGQLDRALYLKVNKVLAAAGGKWERKAQAHVFDCDATHRMDQIILTGEVSVPKDDFDFFPSPPAVVARLLELAEIRSGMRVLEPHAARGAIAFACADLGALVDCCEIQEGFTTFLSTSEKFESVRTMDFLALPPEPVYDRIVMNPPFSKRADIYHVQHALKFLKSNGRLASVMSAGVMYRADALTQSFRERVMAAGGRFEPLPEKSFKPSGTDVSTVIAVIPSA